MGPSIVVQISAIEHHEYCARQCALIHVDGVWAENAHTVSGTRAHRRVDSGDHRSERGRLVLRAIPLWSEVHGLTGRADAVEVLSGSIVQPVEYKSGTRHGLAADLQLCAQAMCLEEMLGVPVAEGFVWYGGTRRRHRVQVNESLREQTLDAVAQIRHAIATGELPVAVDDRRCNACQVRHHCLPELTSGRVDVRSYVEEVVGCAT